MAVFSPERKSALEKNPNPVEAEAPPDVDEDLGGLGSDGTAVPMVFHRPVVFWLGPVVAS